VSADGFVTSAGKSTRGAIGEPRVHSPESEAVSSLTLRMCGNQGDPIIGVQEARTRGQAITSEEAGGGDGKSEASIVAMSPGNAGGAKGRRFEITGEGNTDLHREESSVTTRLERFTQMATGILPPAKYRPSMDIRRVLSRSCGSRP